MTFFLITTIHNEITRWNRIKQHLSANRIKFIPILAPDWKMFEHTQLNPKQYKQQSLTLAYYQIAQTAIFMDLSEYVALEDDINITDLFSLHSLITAPPTSFDLCYLSRTPHNEESANTEPHNAYWNKVVDNYWETPATMWSKRFAARFINHIQGKIESGLWLGHIDHELLILLEAGDRNFFAPVSVCCYGLSNVEQTEMDVAGSINLDVV